MPDVKEPPELLSAPSTDKLSNPNLTPLPMHQGIKHVARSRYCNYLVATEKTPSAHKTLFYPQKTHENNQRLQLQLIVSFMRCKAGSSQQGLLATHLIPGCIGRGVRLGSENLFGSGVWKSGNLEILEFGDLGTWKSRNVGSKNNKRIQNHKVQIRSAQNVGKVWISREKILLALFGAI